MITGSRHSGAIVPLTAELESSIPLGASGGLSSDLRWHAEALIQQSIVQISSHSGIGVSPIQGKYMLFWPPALGMVFHIAPAQSQLVGSERVSGSRFGRKQGSEYNPSVVGYAERRFLHTLNLHAWIRCLWQEIHDSITAGCTGFRSQREGSKPPVNRK